MKKESSNRYKSVKPKPDYLGKKSDTFCKPS